MARDQVCNGPIISELALHYLFRKFFSNNLFKLCYHVDNQTFKYMLKSNTLCILEKFIKKLLKNKTSG